MNVIESTLDMLDTMRWAELISNAGLGTIFSEAAFYRHHDEVKPVSFIQICEGQKLSGGAVGLINGTVFSSPFGASYGGLLIDDSLSFRKKSEVVESFMNWVREKRLTDVRFTFAPSAYSSGEPDATHFLLRYKGFVEARVLYSSIVDMGKSFAGDEDMRNQVRQAERAGLLCYEMAQLDQFFEILEENKRRYNQKPVHTLSELIQLKNLFPESVRFFGAYTHEQKLIAGTMLMKCRPDVWLFFYIASSEQGRKLRAVPLLLQKTIGYLKGFGARIIDFGVSHETGTLNPVDPKYSLIHFKENFGARGALRTSLNWSTAKAKGGDSVT
jgi:hypothetical protein